MQENLLLQRVEQAKGDPLAIDAIIREYLPFIRSETSKALAGRSLQDRDDELSIAMIAFHEAVESFSAQRGAFLAYASLLIQRKLIDYHRRQQRHSQLISLNESLDDAENETQLLDRIAEPQDAYLDMEQRQATQAEIEELVDLLRDFDLSLSDIAQNCPQQERTLRACQKALAYARENPQLIAELKRTGRLPMAQLARGSGVERKTLERHRRYIVALLLIYSNGFEMIRGHLKQVAVKRGRN